MASRPPLSREQRKEINIMFFHMLICIILIFFEKKDNLHYSASAITEDTEEDTSNDV